MYWIKPPTMKQWTVNGNLTTVKLAPGLESQVTVSFMSRDEKDITDRLLVATEVTRGSGRVDRREHTEAPRIDKRYRSCRAK